MPNEVVKKEPEPTTVSAYMESGDYSTKLNYAAGLTKQSFNNAMMNCMSINPKLKTCSLDSFRLAVAQMAQLGLLPDGRRAHLIPYFSKEKNVLEAKLIVDYKGYVDLAFRTGKVLDVKADIVHEKDTFEHNMCVIERHTWDLTKPRGNPVAVWAQVTLSNGTKQGVILSKDEVEAVRNKSRSKDTGPWKEFWGEMSKKSAFKRLQKWLPMTPLLEEAFEADDDFDGDITIPETGGKAIENAVRNTRKRKSEPEPEPKAEEALTVTAEVVEQPEEQPAGKSDPLSDPRVIEAASKSFRSAYVRDVFLKKLVDDNMSVDQILNAIAERQKT